MIRPLSILGTGGITLPLIDNANLLQYLNAPKDGAWLERKVGIQTHSLNFDCATGKKIDQNDGLDYAVMAAFEAMQNAGISADEIDQICYTTCTPRNLHFMADTIELHRILGLRPTAIVDQIDGGCAALAKGFQLAKLYANGKNPNWKALIVGSNDVASMINKERYELVPYAWQSPSIFGDGAGAVVLGHGEGKPWLDKVYCAVNGDHPLVTYEGGGTAHPTSMATLNGHVYVMDGPDVATQFGPAMTRGLDNLLVQAGLTVDDVERFYLHQANLRLIHLFARSKKIPMDRIPHNVDRFGNTVSASTLLLLNEDMQNGLEFRKPILFCYVGAGMMEGGALFLPGDKVT